MWLTSSPTPMAPRRRRRAASPIPTAPAALLLFLLTARGVAADNLSCNGTGMDWYIDMVGETPCLTYQKLRQICNSQFQTGVMNVNTPPDACTDQLSECCCNNVAFALSMLCLNCQQNIGTGTGFDAGKGAYQDYLGSCSSTKGLPSDIQTAVCNRAIKIDDDLYTNGWDDGEWFYIFSRDTIIKDNVVANNNSFTHCASTMLNQTSSASGSASAGAQSSSSSSTAGSGSASHPSTSANADTLPTTTSKKLGGGAAAGIAVGALAALAAAAAAFWFCFYKRRREASRAGILEGPFEDSNSRGGGMRQRDDGTDPSLVPTSYPYSDNPPTSAPSTSEYFDGPTSPSNYGGGGARSDAGGSSSASGAGFAGLGAATMRDADSRSTSTGPGAGQQPRRGFHTQQQPSVTSTSASIPNPYGAASVSGSGSGSEHERRPAGAAAALPRKLAREREAAAAAAASAAGSASGASATRSGSGRRAGSEEPFLGAGAADDDEHDSWRDVGSSSSERHRDAGPIDVSLSRSASGRLPPAYGEQI